MPPLTSLHVQISIPGHCHLFSSILPLQGFRDVHLGQCPKHNCTVQSLRGIVEWAEVSVGWEHTHGLGTRWVDSTPHSHPEREGKTESEATENPLEVKKRWFMLDGEDGSPIFLEQRWDFKVSLL